jgi:alpha-amylase
MSFGGMPDLCHRNPSVYTAMLQNAEWLINDIGFDGFRFDFVKGYGGWMVRPFSVGECWDNSCTIGDWLNELQRFEPANPML